MGLTLSIKEQLNDFHSGRNDIRHMVFGDLSSGMVLFAASSPPKGQEEHDRMVSSAAKVLGSAGPAFGQSAETDGSRAVLVHDDAGTVAYVPAGAEADEALILKLSVSANPVEVCRDAAEVLAALNEPEGEGDV